MSNKGEDVKHLFAHLGLDPSTYRDIKGDDASSSSERKPSSRKASRKQKAADPVVAPEEMPPPPRVQRAEDRPDIPPPGMPEAPETSAEDATEAEAAEAEAEVSGEASEPAEVFESDEPLAAVDEGATEDRADATDAAVEEIEVSPDRWALLAKLGDQTFPVAEIPDEPVELGEWSHAPDPAEEADTDRLKRAGSLAALLRGSERVVDSVKRSASPVDTAEDSRASEEDSAHEAAVAESVDDATQAEAAAGQEVTMTDMREHADRGESSEEPVAARRPSSGAIAKLMGRLGQPPAPRRHEGAKLKLRYERREAPVVAESQLDQRLPSVFGRLEKSRVD